MDQTRSEQPEVTVPGKTKEVAHLAGDYQGKKENRQRNEDTYRDAGGGILYSKHCPA
jgi:hypothetical protein